MHHDETPAPQAALKSALEDELEEIVSRVAAMLAAAAPAPAPAPAGSGGRDLHGLAGMAEARREAARERRELAMELVIGALLNEGNADWDPRSPGTCRATFEGRILQAIS